MSNHMQRFNEVQQAFFNAEDHYGSDLAACAGDEERRAAVQANLYDLETETFRAATSVLSKTGEDVEAAYQLARAARADIIARRKAAAGIADLIRGVSANLDSVRTLIDKAKSRDAKTVNA